MKRFWLVLLSLGLIVAFSTSAMAVDVKFNGEYYAAGMYLSKTDLRQDQGPSTAFYYQRLRLGTQFIVSPGLKLVTRVDIMERAWGAARATANTKSSASASAANDIASAGSTVENENIAFDLVYVQYISPIGIFNVGYQDDGAWGTTFGDTTAPLAKAVYIFMKGGIAAGAYVAKFADYSKTIKNTGIMSTSNDRDVDMYVAFVNFAFKQGQTGLLMKHYRANVYKYAFASPTGTAISQVYTALLPYAKVKFGPISAEAEIIYIFGDYYKHNQGTDATVADPDVSMNQLAAYVNVVADFGKAYVGVTGAYMSGDDPATKDKKEGGATNGGLDWNPCLIMFNGERYYWGGQIGGYNGSANPNTKDNSLATNDAGMTNAWFAQLRGGVRPVDKLDVMMSISYAVADKTILEAANTTWLNRSYGYEVDVTATYKITNNLSYMLGGGYWWVGDYYKGLSNDNQLQNNYMLINKLTLTF
jgi:hypothetical protein